MNIEQYRALKAKELENSNKPEAEEAIVEQTPVVEETKTEEPAKEEVVPELIEIEIEGQKLTLDELKSGYLRQSDYTKKTQELSRQRKEAEEAIKLFESLKQNPQAVEQIKTTNKVPASLDPATAKIVELENKMYDMMLEKEIETLQSKYKDFEVREVLEMAQKKNIMNLEDAYLLVRSQKSVSTDVESIKEQIRKELLAELEKEKKETSTIISSQADPKPVTSGEPQLSPAELKVAKNMGMTPQEYAKWRNIDRKK
jgi:phage I-like protein